MIHIENIGNLLTYIDFISSRERKKALILTHAATATAVVRAVLYKQRISSSFCRTTHFSVTSVTQLMVIGAAWF